MIPNLSLRAWGAIGVGVIIILLVGLCLRLDGLRAGYKAERDVAVIKLETTAASVDRLARELARVKAEQQALSAGDQQRITASRETLQLAEAASKVRQAAIEKLLASAGIIRPEDRCEVSDAVKELWK